MEIIAILFSILLLFVIALFFIDIFYFFKLKSGFVPASYSAIKKILENVKLQQGQIVYDLGCGDGRFLFAAEKKYGIQGIGYEFALIPYLLAQIRKFIIRSKAQIYRKNFFSADLSSADIVFCYLLPEILGQLKPKFQKELKNGSKIISYKFPITNWIEPEVINLNSQKVNSENVFIYKIR